MKYELNRSLEILGRTPGMLNAWLTGISDKWAMANEGADTWSAYDVVGHLIVCEETNFMTRINIIFSDAGEKIFTPIDLTVQFSRNEGKTMNDLLAEFESARKKNIAQLAGLNISEHDFLRTGLHPTMGEIKLGELLSTWVAHDLIHTAQIARVMAKQYKDEVGPFIQYLRVMQS
jgi:uncharacterized damage-inducible protein DinB